MVDGEPFLILGALCHNSTAWPAILPQVWTAMAELDVNTLEIPVYWEQFEPRPGQYTYDVIDTFITEAREHGLRLVLLWFAVWDVDITFGRFNRLARVICKSRRADTARVNSRLTASSTGIRPTGDWFSRVPLFLRVQLYTR
ncbi:MAG TPA: beta-galactosidase [bacterium]|nr:beta-galactosidase [bacterium]HQG46277.1 beta-galactosidase [bacterium]HQI47370.1 beta-galactosidase [bacterium]HQJ63028.1 beta-galactosidase [bacterium]